MLRWKSRVHEQCKRFPATELQVPWLPHAGAPPLQRLQQSWLQLGALQELCRNASPPLRRTDGGRPPGEMAGGSDSDGPPSLAGSDSDGPTPLTDSSSVFHTRYTGTTSGARCSSTRSTCAAVSTVSTPKQVVVASPSAATAANARSWPLDFRYRH